MEPLAFWLNDREMRVEGVSPTMTLLQFLRERAHLTGTKEGCAEGDCGACTVAWIEPRADNRRTFRAVNACLVLLPMVQGRRVYTVEGLHDAAGPHPVQEAMVRRLGSQCGYCTPGVVMSLFEACYRDDLREPAWQIDDQMCGNLCRCTGYRPIRDAALDVAGRPPSDRFAARLAQNGGNGESFQAEVRFGPQRYFNPRAEAELFDVLDAHADARVVAGGTDLSLEVTKRFAEPPCLVSVEGIPTLRRIERTADGFVIGAAATLTQIQEALACEHLALEKMLRFFASRQIRNRATVGGNLCTASPIGDLAPVLIALRARVELRSREGARTLPLEEFFVSYRKTALNPREILASVFLPHLPNDARASSFKVSKRRELDISTVAAGCYVRVGPDQRIVEARLAYGGMAAIPARATATEAALVGRPFSRDTILAAMPRIDEDYRPITDHRGSAWYRSQVAKNLLLGFWLETKDGAPRSLAPRPTSTIHASDAP
jgi:xanthine dehydrogenase small subunit